MSETGKYEFNVAGSTNTRSLAYAIRSKFEEDPSVRLSISAIGVKAVSNAVKAVVELNKLFASIGYYVTILPTYDEREVSDLNDSSIKVNRTTIIHNLHIKRVG